MLAITSWRKILNIVWLELILNRIFGKQCLIFLLKRSGTVSKSDRSHNWEIISILGNLNEHSNYRPRFFREILDQTDGLFEGIANYSSIISALSNDYGNLPDDDFELDIIFRNLSSFYINQFLMFQNGGKEVLPRLLCSLISETN